MITDFPQAKQKIKKILDEILRQQVKRNAPMLSLISKRRLHEGDKMGVIDSDGSRRVNDFKRVQSDFFISQSEAQNITTQDIITKVSGAAQDMAGQIERGLFQIIEESVKKSGNVISGNPELFPDSMLTALEMVQVDFQDDDRSKPIRLSIVAAPATAEKLMQSKSALTPEQKEEYNKKEEAILDKKYQEHLKDLESRKIID